MKKRTLGRTSLQVSVVGFGGIPIQGVKPDLCDEILNTALDQGINFIDTARGYTDSESKIGRALKGRREEYVLATKSMVRDGEGMKRELETSLKNLRTDVIDLYQIHNAANDQMLDAVLAKGGAYEALAQARDQGTVRHIGITGHSKAILKRALETDLFDTVQHPLNPIEAEWADEVLPLAKEKNAGLICMKPVAGGAISNVPAALRFALETGMDTVIPGMDTVDQVRMNARVGATLRPMDDEDRRLIEEDKTRWQGAFCRRCGYCKPCPNGLDITFLLLIEAYHTRYGGLEGWAMERLAGLEKKFADCTGCKECETRCPYNLPIADLMEKASNTVR